MIESACIIGAGVAGLATGVALEARGVSVRIFEQAPELRSFGGALTLWSNAVRALRALGVEERVRAVGCPLSGMDFRAQDGRLLWRMPVGETSRRHAAPTLVVPRAALVESLAGALRHPVTLGKRYLQHIERARSIDVQLEGGQSAAADLLIGADGARSLVRPRLGVRNESFCTGQIIWVGRSTISHPSLIPGAPVATLGRGLRFWAAPMPEGDVWWYAIVQVKHGADTLADVQALFAQFHEPVPSLIASVEPSSFRRAELLDQAPTLGWSAYRATLIGDAAHCSRPDVGQGACQALESAVVLADALAREANLQKALREYELSRFPRTSHVGLLGRIVAFHAMAEDPALSTLRNLGIAHLFPRIAAPALEWVLRGSDGC